MISIIICSNLDESDEVSAENIQELKYLTMFFKETYRMYPVATNVIKINKKPMVIEGIKLPKDSKINIGIYQAHYLEEFWPEPDKFDPNRFSPENIDKIHPYSYLSFSAGPRNCIGQKFAILQMQIFVSLLLQKYRILLDEEHSYEPDLGLVCHAKNGIKIKLENI